MIIDSHPETCATILDYSYMAIYAVSIKNELASQVGSFDLYSTGIAPN